MSLARPLRRRHDRSPPEKPQVERIEHANLERPGARLHPRAAGPASSASSATSGPARQSPRPPSGFDCNSERRGA